MHPGQAGLRTETSCLQVIVMISSQNASLLLHHLIGVISSGVVPSEQEQLDESTLPAVCRCLPQAELPCVAGAEGCPGSANQARRAPVAVDHTWHAPLASQEAASLAGPGSVRSDTTAPS